MKKIFILGIVAGAVMLVISMVFNFVCGVIYPSLLIEYNNVNFFRPLTESLASLYFLHPFLLGIILAWVWNKTKTVIIGETVVKKGINFGFVYWIVASIPGMFITYSCFQVSFVMVLSWLFEGLIGGIVAGIIFAKMNK